MLRFLLKLMTLLSCAFLLLLLFMLGIGKTAPESSKIAFFSQAVGGTSYWRVDMFTGISFSDFYSSRIYIPRDSQSSISHYLAIRSDANYNYLSELNFYSREETYIGKYPSRGYNLRVVGDTILSIDNSNQWQFISIPSGEISNFGSYPPLTNARTSPDGQWFAGRIPNQNYYFVNLISGESYEISGYSDIFWSGDSTWMIARDSRRQANIAVLNARDGSPHPVLGQSFPAINAIWSADSQFIFYQNGSHVSKIALATGEIQEYPTQAENFWLPCLSPNQKRIMAQQESNLILLDLETGRELWRYSRSYADLPECLWSADSRYVLLHLSAYEVDAWGNWLIAWQRLIFLDTQTANTWEFFPRNLPSGFSYPHIPE